MLEEIGSNDESLDSNEVEPSPDETQDQDLEEFPEDAENSNETESNEESDFDLESNNSEDISDMDFSDEFAILKEMQEDLKEHFEREYEGEAQLGNSEAEEKRKFFFDSLVSETSLQEHLLDQLKLVHCSMNKGICSVYYREPE